MSTFLSIIVPFHNSAEKCRPLLAVLAQLQSDDDVELIFVDDGSVDNTLEMLRKFADESRCAVTLVERDNGGPGAARNSGLDRASGKWIWFVDSDDVIDLGAIALARDSDWPNADVLAWELDHPHPAVSCKIPGGLNEVRDRPALPSAMETLPAKWFALEFLRSTGLRFPEYCIYEATPIEAFVLPLLLGRYFKSDFQAYRAIAGPSVTRGVGQNPRYFDRLRTIALGRAYVQDARLDPAARSAFDEAFIRLFLWYSIKPSKIPGRSWLTAMRVMRQYRDEARGFAITVDPLDVYPGGKRSRLVARLLWRLSRLMPSQTAYFDRLRRLGWNRPIEWTAPEIPARWRKG